MRGRTDGGSADERATGVLFIHSNTLPPLGADTWVQAQIIAGLDKRRHRVHVACNFGPESARTPVYDAMSTIENITLVAVNLGRERDMRSYVGRARGALDLLSALGSTARLLRYIRTHDIRIIHTTDRPRDAALSVLLGRFTRARSIIHAHVSFDRSWMSKLLQTSIERADALIGVSEFVCRTLVEGGNDPARVHAVLNAIDVSKWTPGAHRTEARAELGLDEDDVAVMTACRLFPAKGPGALMRALAIAMPTCPKLRLVIVGREAQHGYAAELRELARELGIEHAVMFLGQRSDVPALMDAADVFAMPSLEEPFGLVYLEAMAMQLPVVALRSGGAPEIVLDGVTGLLSEPDDIAALAANIERCATDPELRRRLGVSGRRRVEESFPWSGMAEATEAVYRVVLSEPVG